MNIQENLEQKKAIQNALLSFIENDTDTEENYQNILQLFYNYQIKKNKQEIKSILHLLTKISNNYHRPVNFFAKIERIMQYFGEEIKRQFTNFEIFHIFKRNKRILLFLVKEQILKFDQYIISIITHGKYFKERYPHYFYPEIKSFVSESMLSRLNVEITDTFEQKREIGENDDYFSTLIRKDMIDEFITFINQNNMTLNILIKPSIFETNSFLLKYKPTLIEYAAFFGSIQIFKYLYLNEADVDNSLWLYAIHSDNPELIHFLQEKHEEPKDETYERSIKEAIKCHHNNIANYISEHLLDLNVEKVNLETKYNENMLAYSFRYYNYFYFPDDFNSNRFIFFYLCQCDYYIYTKHILETKEININDTIIHNFIILMELILKHFLIRFQINLIS